jgi:hypothetical protein
LTSIGIEGGAGGGVTGLAMGCGYPEA